MTRKSFLWQTVLPASAIMFLGIFNFVPPNFAMSAEEMERSERSVYYAGCYAVRAAGKDPLYRGDLGYREGMDGDGDGIACEPYYGR